MLQTVEYLRAHGLQALLHKFRLNSRRHTTHQNLVLLKYDQLNSPMSERIVWECRGLIVDESDAWRPVSYPFDKFFNHHEGKGPSLDWKTAVLTEKLDGSLVVLYFYAGAWHVSTSSVPDSTGGVRQCGFSFAELFWRVWHAQGLQLPTNVDVCYMFELLSGHVQNLVRQADERIVLVGARDMRTLRELAVVQVPTVACVADVPANWPKPRCWPVDSLQTAVRMSAALDPTQQEGFVALDADFRRLKIKSPQYVALSHLGSAEGRFDARHMLNVVRTNEGSEFLSYLPQHRALYESVRSRFDTLVERLEAAWRAHGEVEDKGAFGRLTGGIAGQPVLFALRNNRVASVREGLAGASIRQLEQWLEMAPT